MMTPESTVADALPSCLPLPRVVQIGDQQWTISVSAVLALADGRASVRLLLKGPYGRHRRARLELAERALLAREYDPQRAIDAMVAWLPHSDEDDVLDLAERDLDWSA